MRSHSLYYTSIILGITIYLASCGTKATKEVQQTTVEVTVQNPPVKQDTPVVELNKDAQMNTDAGKWGTDSIEAKKNFSLYYEFFKHKMYDDAILYWRYIYENAPAARKTTYLNGVTMYEYYANQATDSLTKQAYIDTMMMVYDKRIQYFGEEGDVASWKAVKLKELRPWATQEYADLINTAVNIQQEETGYFVLIPYFNIWLNKYNQKQITREQMLEQYNKVSDIIDYNVANNPNEADLYKQVQELIDVIATKLQTTTTTTTTTSPASCADIKNTYEAQFKANPDDLNLVQNLYSRLSRSNCKSDALYQDVLLKLYKLEPTSQRAKIIAQMYADKSENSTAQKYVQEAINLEPNGSKKASLYLLMAQLERRKGGSLSSSTASQARKYAKLAAELRPGWGKPYMFIGDLYASSGKLCGPGTGWDSQVVAWAAADMWERAKDIDPDFTNEANQSINKYRQYFPKISEGFMRGYKNGETYNIGCWIGASTTIRLIND
ncbi:MAG: hypothetical protein IPM47_05355 [Sphingobacteriales bacterium]|nr:MAG: hypothetical protein IPM47_05355 [Sphingobacteriales bacterium]